MSTSLPLFKALNEAKVQYVIVGGFKKVPEGFKIDQLLVKKYSLELK